MYIRYTFGVFCPSLRDRFSAMDSLIATARNNKVATTLAMQDFIQLKKDYGKEQANCFH
ncbi:MAG: TraM recognition domain-containing protein [Chitinophagaceae bacterium]